MSAKREDVVASAEEGPMPCPRNTRRPAAQPIQESQLHASRLLHGPAHTCGCLRQRPVRLPPADAARWCQEIVPSGDSSLEPSTTTATLINPARFGLAARIPEAMIVTLLWTGRRHADDHQPFAHAAQRQSSRTLQVRRTSDKTLHRQDENSRRKVQNVPGDSSARNRSCRSTRHGQQGVSGGPALPHLGRLAWNRPRRSLRGAYQAFVERE
jgi:hypothetical protein